MTAFADPLGQYTFALPLGWAYVSARSHLIAVAFALPERLEERISVRARPTCHRGASDADWRASAVQQLFEPHVEAHPYQNGSRIALFTNLPALTERAKTQVVLVRGNHLDIEARHESHSTASEGLTAALAMLVRTLILPTDLAPPPELGDQAAFARVMGEAAHAAAEGKWETVTGLAARARVIARDSYLASLCRGALLPEVPAVTGLVDALIAEFRATTDISLARAAEQLIERALFTTQHLQVPLPPGRRQQVLEDLQIRRSTVLRLQESVIQAVWSDAQPGGPLPMLRHEFLEAQAAMALERGEYRSALRLAQMSVEDVLAVLHRVLESRNFRDDEVVEFSNGQQVTGRVAKDISLRFSEGALADATRTLSLAHRALGQYARAREADTLLITLSQRLSTRASMANGHFEPRQGERPLLAAAILDRAASDLLYSEEQTDVTWDLDQASLLLEELKEGADLRAFERVLRATWLAVKGKRPDLRFDRTEWVRHHVISDVPIDTLRKLCEWALPTESTPVPEAVLGRGPGAVIDHALRNHPECPASELWRLTGLEAPEDAARRTDAMLGRWLGDLDWHRGWAAAALRALDPRLPLGHSGLLEVILFVRGNLVQPTRFIGADLEPESDPEAREAVAGPVFASSPFGDPVVRDVLEAIDGLVALHEYQASRVHDLLANLAVPGQHPELEIARQCLATLTPGHLAAATRRTGGAGAAAVMFLRAAVERAEAAGHTLQLRALLGPTLRVAGRYACTADFLMAVHLAAAVTFRSQPSLGLLTLQQHLRLGAVWLGDASLEATVNHAIGLMLRQGMRGTAGILAAIAAFQRAATLRSQLGDELAAAGTLTDLSALLIGCQHVLHDAEPERDWIQLALRYLDEAMALLVGGDDHELRRRYLGEAYQNLARLQLGRDAAASRRAAQRCLVLAESIGFNSLIERARQTLALASHEAPSPGDDPQADAAGPSPTVEEVLSATREQVDEHLRDLRRFASRSGHADAVLDALLEESTPRTLARLLGQVEESRGFTYNRWLPEPRQFNYRRLMLELENDSAGPVFAVYVVARSRIHLIVIEAGLAPRMLSLDLTSAQVAEMVDEHLAALVKHRRTRGSLPWSRFQERLLTEGTKLVRPLAPYVEQERVVCVVPHGVLHGVPLHTLPLTPGAQPIGLMAPIFVNPSLVNWLAARHNSGLAGGALAATTCPADELSQFGESQRIAILLASGLKENVVHLTPEATHLGAIAATPPYRVMHLASHGMFDPESYEMGLLLARDGRLPPPPPRIGFDAAVREHLVHPQAIYRQGNVAKLTFLASCVSSRNASFPGDDLIGLTRAFFAGGATDLIAGAWTVLSKTVEPFAERFYTELLHGASVAHAVLAARRALSDTYPSEFLWGVFQHTGANINPLPETNAQTR